MGSWYWEILPMVLMSVGIYLKRRDSNNTGMDDEMARFVTNDVAPIIDAATNGDDKAVLRAVKAAEAGITAMRIRLEAAAAGKKVAVPTQ